MLRDSYTVFWKEWREIVTLSGGWVRWWLRMVGLALLMGAVLPVFAGRTWLDSPVVALLLAVMAGIGALSSTADLIAGERTRHTLETLLASRLSDRAILLGKVAAVVTQTWLTVVLIAVIGAVSVNVVVLRESLAFYSPGSLLALLLWTPLLAGIAATVGLWGSLYAVSLQQASQRAALIILAFLVPVLGLLLITVYGLPPESRSDLSRFLIDSVLPHLDRAVVLGLPVLALLAVALFRLVEARFHRERLLLV